jgi:hypothetical protein
MKKFTLGAISGMTSLAIAVPLIAQVAGAASGSSVSSAASAKPVRTPPTQACVQAIAARDGAELSNADAMMAAHKAVLQAHQKAMEVAADIADETKRLEAVKQADNAMRSSMKAAMDAQPADIKTTMDAVRTACGKAFRGPGGFEMRGMPGMRGPKGGHGMRHNDDNETNANAESASSLSNTQNP